MAGSCLFFLLLKTYAYYGAKIRAVTGTRVVSWIGHNIARWNYWFRAAKAKRGVDQIAVYILTGSILMSLFLPWIGNWRLAGYQLLLPQKPISQNAELTFYRVDPPIMREMRVQLCFAIAFVALALFTAVFRRERRRLIDVSYYFAIVVLMLQLNLVVYLALLGYNSQRTLMSAVFGMFFGPGTSLASLQEPRGFPLAVQWPMYGFYVFMFGLLGLSLWSALRGTRRRAQNPS